MATYQSLHDLPWVDIGQGWQRATVELGEGEYAPNPASTNRPRLYGPGRVTYEQGPSGAISARVEDL